MNREAPMSDLTYKSNGLTYLGATPFSGVAYSENEMGVREEETSYVDGLRCGLSREWNDDGTLVKEAMYSWDVFHGAARTWHDNGQLERDGEYEYGIALHEKLWDEQGNLLSDYVLSKDDGQYEFLEKLRQIYRGGKNVGDDESEPAQT
ncbi:Putative antitoxin YwqK [Burkholderia aenigmatica]|uniref:Antitoxin YwqK n=1 Tax=Burkholderia aenigmatica TaxID=2015348 RepID=A0A6P2PH54_9BURK|nr:MULTISPECIES: hypothetical protein [Burkholderia]VWC06868.1 Putative antitoxin YwqK [Burkholderia aenigmatica]